MKNFVDYFYIFSKISTSLFLLSALLFLGYFFYTGYKNQEDVYENQVYIDKRLQDSVNENNNKIQEISKKLNSSDKSLQEIQKLVKTINNKQSTNNKNNELQLMLINLDENLLALSLEVKKLKDQINNNNDIIINDNLNNTYINNQKKDLIKLIIIKFKNNIKFDEELNYLEKISDKNKIHLFEKINILINQGYKGKQYTEKIFQEESGNYIRNKINKKTNNFISKVVLPYISIKPSQEINLKDENLLYIKHIESLIKDEEYKKSIDKIKLINNYDLYYIDTSKQLQIAFDFNKLLKEIEN